MVSQPSYLYNRNPILVKEHLHIKSTNRTCMCKALGPDSIQRCYITSIGNPIMEIRWSPDTWSIKISKILLSFTLKQMRESNIKASTKWQPKFVPMLFPGVQLMISHHFSGDDLAPNRWQPFLESIIHFIDIYISPTLNSSLPGQNGRHFAKDIFRCIFVNEKFLFQLKFQWSLFLRVQLTITQHWFR